MSTLALVLFWVFFSLIGLVTLVWPKRIQEYVLKLDGDSTYISKWNPFLDWMRTPGYVVSLRIVGVLATFVSLVALYVLIKRWR